MSAVGTILLHSPKELLCDKFKSNVSTSYSFWLVRRTCFGEYIVLVLVNTSYLFW